jgi:Transcriptional regulators containing a DNA-binding HTH domain and an aminotransferase domain (MocR family) and their eukaryotic orthologs
VLVEAPTYDRPLKILAAHGVEISPVAMDDEGLDPSALEQALGSGREAGVPLHDPDLPEPERANAQHRAAAPPRRACARARPARTRGRSLWPRPLRGHAPPTLFELEGGELVTYSSSFSKTIAPGLRVGYFVLPAALERELEALAVSTYITPVLLGQATVFEFLRRGNFEPNLERVRSLLGARRDAMLEALEAELPGARWSHPEGGYFIWLELPEGTDTTALLGPAGEAGVTYVPGPDFGGAPNTARLAFSFVSLDEIREGVRRLAGSCPFPSRRRQPGRNRRAGAARGAAGAAGTSEPRL